MELDMKSAWFMVSMGFLVLFTIVSVTMVGTKALERNAPVESPEPVSNAAVRDAAGPPVYRVLDVNYGVVCYTRDAAHGGLSCIRFHDVPPGDR